MPYRAGRGTFQGSLWLPPHTIPSILPQPGLTGDRACYPSFPCGCTQPTSDCLTYHPLGPGGLNKEIEAVRNEEGKCPQPERAKVVTAVSLSQAFSLTTYQCFV